MALKLETDSNNLNYVFRKKYPTLKGQQQHGSLVTTLNNET